MEYSIAAALELAKAAPQGGAAIWDPFDAANGKARLSTQEPIAAGVVCVAKTAAVVFASTQKWEHIGTLPRGQVVVAAGPVETVDFYDMVPIEPEGAVDRSSLDVLHRKVEKPSVVGSWRDWERQPMIWDKESRWFQATVWLRGGLEESFLILCGGDWKRCLHPGEDGAPAGPDANKLGTKWIIGDGRAAEEEGSVSRDRYRIRLFVDAEGYAERVDWYRAAPLQAADDSGGRPQPAEEDRPLRCPPPQQEQEREEEREEHEDAADAGTELQRGMVVCIHGLTGGRATLNDQHGMCEAFDDAAGCWLVHLAGTGEVESVRPRHLQEVLVDFSGTWGNTEGEDVVTIFQDGRSVTVSNPHQRWSPAYGGVLGNVITVEQPFMEGARQGVCAEGLIEWDNHVVWYFLEEAADDLREAASAGPPGEDALEPDDVPALRPGMAVCIHGLRSAPQFNGEEGACEKWDVASGRWKVRLRSGDVKALRPENLRPVCCDFSGLWGTTEGADLSRISQSSCSVTITNSQQHWSPARGSVSGSVLTLDSPASMGGRVATLSGDGLIEWTDHTVWYRLEDDSTDGTRQPDALPAAGRARTNAAATFLQSQAERVMAPDGSSPDSEPHAQVINLDDMGGEYEDAGADRHCRLAGPVGQFAESMADARRHRPAAKATPGPRVREALAPARPEPRGPQLVKVAVKHATSSKDAPVELEVMSDLTMGAVKAALAAKLQRPEILQKGRFVQKRGLASFTGIKDAEPLGDRRALIFMGTELR